MKNKISYLILSDIHLGHKNNTTIEIVSNLREYFKINHNIFNKLDIVIIAGDIFDKLLATSSIEFILTTEWLTELAMYCKGNNIKLRILEGTPSHDWKQARVIDTVLTRIKLDIDFKYISTLTIEHIDSLDIDILYVPDEWKHKAVDTYEEVKELLITNNISKVDVAIMHGQFNYQLPIILESSHKEDDYLDIVKYYISIGHIHNFSVNNRIIAQGSFDRLTHGEEEDKGGVVISIYSTGDMEFKFIKNNTSKIFNTYKFDISDIDIIVNNLASEISKLPKDSYIRIIVPNDSDLKGIVKPITNTYPNYNFKIEYNTKVEVMGTDVLETVSAIESFHIDSGNIETLLMKELSKHNIGDSDISIAAEELNRLI